MFAALHISVKLSEFLRASGTKNCSLKRLKVITLAIYYETESLKLEGNYFRGIDNPCKMAKPNYIQLNAYKTIDIYEGTLPYRKSIIIS